MAMTTSRGVQEPQQPEDTPPAEIEALLPWYAAGTLRRRDRKRVEAALGGDADFKRQADLVREELAETICLNESLGAPSAKVLDRLMATIDAETRVGRKLSLPRVLAGRFAAFVAGFSPRTLAVAACCAVLAISLQAFLLVGMFTSPQAPTHTAGLSMEQHGPFATVRFVREANAGEITSFLQDYQATVVDGPKPDGSYRVKIGVTTLAKEELARVVARMRREHVIESADASE
jgi:anti-sigma-K factor RskA